MSDEKFAVFFQEWCKENHIKEYTLIDKFGSFSVVNNDGIESYFILHTDHSLEAFQNVNDDVEEAAPYLKSIQSRQTIPFFGVGIDSWMIEPVKWRRYFHPAIRFSGRENYYWASANKSD